MSGKKLREIHNVTMPLVVRFHKLQDFYLFLLFALFAEKVIPG